MEHLAAFAALSKLVLFIVGMLIGFVVGLIGGAAATALVLHWAADADEEYEDAVKNDTGLL
ncbi:MAG: hypothetical protein EOM40_10035 [Clostridia bacterium]|nr:hypothetical protein [Clostridia bacterium]